MCREGQTESPCAIIYANPDFVGDQVSFELKLNRGENDMELRRKLTSQEYKSYGNIQNLIPEAVKMGSNIGNSTAGEMVARRAHPVIQNWIPEMALKGFSPSGRITAGEMVASKEPPIRLSTFSRHTLSFTPEPPSHSEFNNETNGEIQAEHRGNTELQRS